MFWEEPAKQSVYDMNNTFRNKKIEVKAFWKVSISIYGICDFYVQNIKNPM